MTKHKKLFFINHYVEIFIHDHEFFLSMKFGIILLNDHMISYNSSHSMILGIHFRNIFIFFCNILDIILSYLIFFNNKFQCIF